VKIIDPSTSLQKKRYNVYIIYIIVVVVGPVEIGENHRKPLIFLASGCA
jgi:hypothetical protein